MRLWSVRLLFIVSSLLFTVLLLEGALRVLGMFPPLTPYARFIEHDPTRGWRNVAGASGHYSTDEFRVWLEYNERSYRGPLRDYVKSAGTTRILLLGDSFVEAFTTALDERVSNVLERQLHTGQRPVEVIALGTSGYATDQQLLWLESEGLKYQPDVLVLMFYYNDLWVNTDTTGKPRYVANGDSLRLTNVPVPRRASVSAPRPSPLRRAGVWLTQHTHLGALGSRAVKTSPALRAAVGRAGVLDQLAGPVYHDSAAGALPLELRVFAPQPDSTVDQAWTLTEALIARVEQHATAIGADLLIFHIPFRFEVQRGRAAVESDRALDAARLDLRAVPTRLLAMCARRSLRCIEPTDAFIARADSLAGSGSRLYYQFDWHWTSAGHALAAQILADSLAPLVGQPIGRVERAPGVDGAAAPTEVPARPSHPR